MERLATFSSCDRRRLAKHIGIRRYRGGNLRLQIRTVANPLSQSSFLFTTYNPNRGNLENRKWRPGLLEIVATGSQADIARPESLADRFLDGQCLPVYF